jgi:hypothetical protein
MAVALRTFEELEHRDVEVKRPVWKRQERIESGKVGYEFPYDDLYQMYDYITKELGIE